MGLKLTADTAARTTEALGAVAEQDLQQAMAAKPTPLSRSAAVSQGDALTLMVGVNATKAHAGGRWRDVKVGGVGPLGPEFTADAESGRRSLIMGDRQYCAGIEEADRFFDRVAVLTHQAGWQPGRPMRVLLLGDGGPWIWQRAKRLQAGGIELVEILDIYHAREHVWAVTHQILGEDVRARQWGENLGTAMLSEGAAVVLKALIQEAVQLFQFIL